jgi:hypothetical protein
VDVRVAEGLRRRGVEASTAYDEQKVGVTDEDQLAQAAGLGAVIFTHDPDLIEIAREINRRGDDHRGVIFVDTHRLRLGECIRRLALYADVVSAEEMVNRIEFL